MVRIIRLLIRVIVLWIVVHCIYATVTGLKDFNGQADIAIVPGNTVHSDGSLSPWLKGRVDAALELYRKKQVKKIMVSGGVGESKFPEGDAMRNYLVENNVPVTDIFTDNAGDNSYLTARHFVELNDKEHFRSAVVVTSFYHVLRCKYIVKKLGFENVYGDHSRSYFIEDLIGLLRDFAAYYKYMLVY